MLGRILLALVLVCIIRSPAIAADRVKLALPAKSMGYLPLFAAIHRGFFKDENIEIETPMMLPQLAHNALLSGDIDYHGVADSALRLAAKGAPIKSIFFGADRPNYFLMAKPQLKSIQELRGKYIGIVRFGDTIELATRIAFDREGMDAGRDAQMIMIGLPSTRVAALTAGSVDATVVVPPDNVLLRQKGFRELLFLGNAIEFPSNGYSTTERQLNEKRDLTKRLLRGLYRGLTFARERPDDAVQIIEREWKVDATVVVPPDNVLLKQKGFRELLFLGDAIEFPSNGYSTTDRQLNERRDLTKRMLRGLYRGLTFARERPDDAVQIIEREWKVDAVVAREAYFSVAKSFSKDGTASEAGLKIHINQIQRADKTIGEVASSKIVDFRPLEEIRREMIK